MLYTAFIKISSYNDILFTVAGYDSAPQNQALKVKFLIYSFEKKKELSEKMEKLEISHEALTKQKQSLEELNSTWSQKIVEQKDEMDLMKTKITEMETLIEETIQKLDMKNMEVETLKDKANTEVGTIDVVLPYKRGVHEIGMLG